MPELEPERERAAAARPEVVAGDPFWGAPLVGLLYLGSILLLLLGVFGLHRLSAWLPAFDGRARVAAVAALAAAEVAVSLLALRHALPRKGWVEVHPDRLVVSKRRGQAEALPFADLERFSLPAADYVQLHRRGEARPQRRHTVPTPRPETRERVVALLRARGLTGP